MAEKRRALGRGLGALIPSAPGNGGRPVDVFFPERQDASRLAGSTLVRAPRDIQRTDPASRGDVDDTGDEALDLTEPHLEEAHVTRAQPPGAPHTQPETWAPGGSPEHGPAIESLAPVPGASFAELAVTDIRPNPRQPRTVFDEDALAELAHSIREIGVLQPVVVRVVSDDQQAAADQHADTPGPARYELVMGERRWRAAQVAGLDTIPAIIKDTRDDALLRDALLENLHRSQLNPLEEAAAYQQLLDDFGCSHDELAARIGRSRPQISNTLRLLRLPPLVQRRVAAGVLTAGHARALLGLTDGAAMERLAQRIVAEGLSVRSVEELVALGVAQDVPATPRRPRQTAHSPQLDDLSANLSDRLDTRVSIALGRRKGKLTVEFATVDDLHRILDVMGMRDTQGEGA